MFVYVKDDKVIRVTPIDLDDSDAASWSVFDRWVGAGIVVAGAKVPTA